MTAIGLVRAARHDPDGTHLTAAAAIGATELHVEWAELFTDEGGVLELNGVQLGYDTSSDTDNTITLSVPLAAAGDVGDPVNVVDGGQVRRTYELDVDLGDGDLVPIAIPYEQRDLWPAGDYADPVEIHIDDNYEHIVNVPQRTPGRDPQYIKTGTLAADTTIIAGDPEGKRVVMDGSGTPGFEAYDSTNTQTVNIDGEQNFIQGTLATAPDGEPRIEIGQGETFGFPATEARLYTGHVDEIAPAELTALTLTSSGDDVGALQLVPPQFDDSHALPAVNLISGNGAADSRALVSAENVLLAADGTSSSDPTILLDQGTGRVTITGPVDATMGDGDVGTGSFRDSIQTDVAQIKAWARIPDVLIAGTITRDANGAATSAPVVWPDGTPGTFTADELSTDFPGAVDGYHITYGSPATATYTQPTITRDASSGVPTDVPEIVVT